MTPQPATSGGGDEGGNAKGDAVTIAEQSAPPTTKTLHVDVEAADASASRDDERGEVNNDKGSSPSSSALTTTTTPISSSKARLQAVLGNSGDFDQIVKERIKNRKERDEHSVAKLKVQMSHLERALAAEVKRRVESHRDVERSCDERVRDLEGRLNKLLDDRSQAALARLDALESRMDALEGRFDDLARDVPSRVEETGRRLGDRLDELRADFRAEKRDRLNREGRILRQLRDHEEASAERLDAERAARDEKLAELRMAIERNEGGRIGADEAFSALIDRELAALREQTEREVRERKMEDDAIVEAMNRFTAKVQSTLSSW